MTLQVRLVHALGDRLIDLPEKTIDSPIVVGRATDAQVQVPSVNVSRRHCVLFVHEGQWVVQDGGGARGTFINGQSISGPTFINSGDVLTLGREPQAPTLAIDPFGLRQALGTENRDAAVASAPPVQESAPDAPPQPAYAAAYRVPHVAATSWEQPGPTYGTGFGSGEQGVPEIVDDREADDAPVEDMVLNNPAVAAAPPLGDSSEDWMTAAGPGAAQNKGRRYYIPRQSAWSPGVIAAMVIGCIGILGIGGYVYSKREQTVEEARKKAEAPKPKVVAPSGDRKNIFDDMDAEVKRKEAAEKAQAARDAGKKVVAAEDAAPLDPGRSTPEWLHVESVHSGAEHDPVKAILVYDDYLKFAPQSPYAADIRKYTDEAMDLLWWSHINELIKTRDDLRKQIGEKNRELAQSQDAAFKKTVAAEKAPLEAKLAQIQEQLKERNYLSEEKPNVFDATQMAALRESRNPEMYETWKKGAEKLIKESRGSRMIWK